MSSMRHKIVLKSYGLGHSMHGIKTLVHTSQPYIDGNGNIDMSNNSLLVKNIEAGVAQFTTNQQTGVINTYSDSSYNSVSCINFKHNLSTSANNRKYCSFQPTSNNYIAGSITGNGGQISYNTTSDSRLTNILNTSGKYYVNSQYNSWLDSVKSLTPCVYRYTDTINDQVGSGGHRFPYVMDDGVTENYVDYQGFLANQVNLVYPPAVTGISGETINVNGIDEPIYQQLDMIKLIPMMVGAIKELSNTVTGLTSEISNLTLLSILNPMWGDWTVLKYSDSIMVFTTTDTTKGIQTYNNTYRNLQYKSWGIQSSDNNLSLQDKQSYLSYLLSKSVFKWPQVTDIRFIYNISSDWNSTVFKDEFSYNYYIATSTSPNVFIDASVNITTDISNSVAIIYDLNYESTYNEFVIYSTLSTTGFTFSTFGVSDNINVWKSTFTNETNSLNTFYTSIQPNLTSTYWGINQYNTTISNKKTYVYDQINNNKLINLPSFILPADNQFIYDYTYTGTTYNYSYYTVSNSSIIDSSFNATDPSGSICLFYDTLSI